MLRSVVTSLFTDQEVTSLISGYTIGFSSSEELFHQCMDWVFCVSGTFVNFVLYSPLRKPLHSLEFKLEKTLQYIYVIHGSFLHNNTHNYPVKVETKRKRIKK